MEGEAVEKWNKKSVNLSNEIRRVWALLKNPNRLNVYAELSEREKRLGAEKDLVEKRLKEFKSAMNSLLVHLEGKRTTTEVVVDGEGNNVKLFNLEGDYDWRRIHSLMLRECRRLEDGLPIYAYRQDILRQIHCQQVLFYLFIYEVGFARFFMNLLVVLCFGHQFTLY